MKQEYNHWLAEIGPLKTPVVQFPLPAQVSKGPLTTKTVHSPLEGIMMTQGERKARTGPIMTTNIMPPDQATSLPPVIVLVKVPGPKGPEGLLNKDMAVTMVGDGS